MTMGEDMAWYFILMKIFFFLPLVQAVEVRIFMQYVDQAINGYNDKLLPGRFDVRTCLHDCAGEPAVTNLRSVDIYRTTGACYCQSVTKDDVPAAWQVNNGYTCYQYNATLADGARMYSCDVASGDDGYRSARCTEAQPIGNMDYVLIIVAEGSLVPSPSRPVKTKLECSYRCIREPSCTTYVILEMNAAIYCSLYNNLN